MPRWPENPDDYVDPAIAPLIEAGEGESEGFDVAEADLIEPPSTGTSTAPTPSGGTPRASARKRSRDSTTTATARATTRTRKPDRATRCHEAGEAAGRLRDPSLRTTSMSARSAIRAIRPGRRTCGPPNASSTRPTLPRAVSVCSSSPVTRVRGRCARAPNASRARTSCRPSLLRHSGGADLAQTPSGRARAAVTRRSQGVPSVAIEPARTIAVEEKEATDAAFQAQDERP